MHWTDRRHAKAELGKALERQGWTLLGWKEDRSDSMTDYYDPESWQGIATRAGVICVVDGGAHGKSGADEVRLIPQAGEPCPRCEGSGVDPSGWTLDTARAEPERYNREMIEAEYGPREDGVVVRTLFPGVVSPIPFSKPGGRRSCVKCNGRGHAYGEPRQEVVFTWPQFQPNPPRRLWHIEKGGRIVASGVGLSKCLKADYGETLNGINPGADELAEKITRAAGF